MRKEQSHLALIIDPDSVSTGFAFGEVFAYSDGLAAACHAMDGISDGSGYGCIDLYGNIMIPFQWAWCEAFTDGKAVVTYEAADPYANLLIDRNGMVVEILSPDRD